MSEEETKSSTAVNSESVLTRTDGIVGETFTEKFKRKFQAQPLVPMYVVVRAVVMSLDFRAH